MKSAVELTARKATQVLKLTRIQFILMKIVEMLFMNPSEEELCNKHVERRFSRICFFLGKNGIRTLAQAIAKDGMSALVNSLHGSVRRPEGKARQYRILLEEYHFPGILWRGMQS